MDQLYQERNLVEVYDALNASRDDFDFYLERLPPPPSRVVDIGCGTGKFALELAARGYRATGVDPAAEMIAAARRKPSEETVQWIVGLISDLQPGAGFDAAVMTGHAFQCLLQDDEISALFRHVAARLRAGGCFWFETRNPAAKAWTRWTPEYAGPPVALGDGRTVHVLQDVQAVDADRVTLSETYIFNAGTPKLSSQSILRFTTLDQLTTLATAAGLRVESVFGDWTGADMSVNSPEIILRLAKDH